MQGTTELTPRRQISGQGGEANPSRAWLSLLAFAAVLVALWIGFDYLRDKNTPQLLGAVVAVIWGVGGVAALFTTANMFVEALTLKWRDRLQPYIFAGPGVALLTWFLLIPTLRTLWQSLFRGGAGDFIGLDNYGRAFTDSGMQGAFLNNLYWLVGGTAGCVISGLLIAVLADRSRFETVAKALIFLPMAISFVGASIIWRNVYAYAPADAQQTGLLNGIITAFGGEPQTWLQTPFWNTVFLIIVLIWMQTGFAMVILSAALKGVPGELLEAARLDGASEIQAFFRVIVPYIQGTIITVTTTIAIFTLKIFDVVNVMTGGNQGTDVVATEFYHNYNNDAGYGSAIAIVLFIAVLPIMIYNLRQFRKQEGF